MTTKKQKQKAKQKVLNSIPIFLAKTYRIVDNPAHAQIIGWVSDGNGFVIKNVTDLTEKIFPRYFKHNNFTSFVRQLNLYGFRKIRSAEEGQIFYHENFSQEKPQNLRLIKRKNAGTGNRGGIDEQEEGKVANEVAIRYQPKSLAVIPANQSTRELELENELMVLSEKHESLQNMVTMLVEQNKQIIMQNKNFLSKIGKMDDSYRKKLETLIFLMVFGLKNGENNIIIPQKLNNMIKAFTSKKKDIRHKDISHSEPAATTAVTLFKPEQSKFNNKNIDEILHMLRMESEEAEGGDAAELQNELRSLKLDEMNRENQIPEEQFRHDLPSPIHSLKSYPSRLDRERAEDWNDILGSLDNSDMFDLGEK